MSDTKRHAKQYGFDIDGQRCDGDAVNQGLCHAHSEQLRRKPGQDMRALPAAHLAPSHQPCTTPGPDQISKGLRRLRTPPTIFAALT